MYSLHSAIARSMKNSLAEKHPRNTGGKAGESDEYIITNTLEATITCLGCTLLQFGIFCFVSELSQS